MEAFRVSSPDLQLSFDWLLISISMPLSSISNRGSSAGLDQVKTQNVKPKVEFVNVENMPSVPKVNIE